MTRSAAGRTRRAQSSLTRYAELTIFRVYTSFVLMAEVRNVPEVIEATGDPEAVQNVSRGSDFIRAG